ncbi:aspartate/glutamate racemase family protein [Vibrio mediterranei]|uniref:aspartate/glutamate racemase family protein n=1 Tax=Vibrio mediterranei TaxID=689 RepID=UPI001EFCCF51|nr:aspartate/glutamate racemase family protein [Vibrio mediterranei]MCG9623726.1 aspartate/glutamate racemase family protein [Vibrio mediterranei]
MKTIGLLGGMSWESTANYYKAINEGVKRELGGFHSAKVALYSVDFAEIESLQRQGDWDAAARCLSESAKSIEAAGADCLLICTNTMHKVSSEIESIISIPLLHIADATAERLKYDGVTKVGLLGTAFTMEQSFYKGRLEQKYDIEVVVPNPEQRALVHEVIYSELVKGKVSDTSRQSYLTIIESLRNSGAQAIILGCTEIAMLIEQKHTNVPLYDTTQIHSEAAVEFALNQ